MKTFLCIVVCLAATCKTLAVELFLCENGLEMFDKSLALIQEAKRSVEISTPFLGGKICRKLLATLEKRLEENAKLIAHILAGGSFLEEQDAAFLKSLKKKFPKQFFYLLASGAASAEPDITSMRNHVKLICVDERYFVIGSTNLHEVLCTDGSTTPRKKSKDQALFIPLPAGARDGDLMGKSDAISQEVRQIFFLTYALFENFDTTKIFIKDPYFFKKKNRYFPVEEKLQSQSFDQLDLAKTDKVRVFFSGPFDAPCNAISSFYQNLISMAESSVEISNPYFSPIPSLYHSLLDFVNRGGQLKVITNGISDGITPEINKNFAWANRIHYAPVMCGREFYIWQKQKAYKYIKENVDIFEYHVPDVVYHKKAVIIDDRHYIIGSYNLNLKSDFGDYEMILYVASPEIVKKAKMIFEKEKNLSVKISTKNSINWYFDLWISYLGSMQKKTQGLS